MVEGDAGAQREEALAQADTQAVQGAGAVAFEAKHDFAGPEDGFDSLADGREVGAVSGLIATGRADHVGAEFLDGSGEAAADVFSPISTSPPAR